MGKFLFAIPLLATLVGCGTQSQKAEPSTPGIPAFSFATTPYDSHVIELREWAERNHIAVAGPGREGTERFEVLVVGCVGDPECFFVHESNGKTRVIEPRLKKDWNQALNDGSLAEKIRQMNCESAAAASAQGTTGECQVWILERTREELRESSPEIARLMTELERSPAKIDIIKKRKRP